MNSYVILKTLHILCSVVLVGTGFGSAFYLFMLNRSQNIEVIRAINRAVVFADHCFTIPSIVLQPLTGWYLMKLLGLTFQAYWLKLAVIFYIVAGACWLPAYFLQLKISALADQAKSAAFLPAVYKRSLTFWTFLGVPSFFSMLAIYYLMVSKPS